MSEEFLRMGGYALYVWISFGLAAVIYLWNVLTPRAQRRAIAQQLTEDA